MFVSGLVLFALALGTTAPAKAMPGMSHGVEVTGPVPAVQPVFWVWVGHHRYWRHRHYWHHWHRGYR